MQGQFDHLIFAQEPIYARVHKELQAGRKASHWMWFIFPQIAGLGRSPMAQRFALASIHQANDYLQHPILGPRLIECTRLMLGHTDKTATQILGTPDNLKLQSSMTLFALCNHENDVFSEVLDAFYGGQQCSHTASFGSSV